MIKILSRNTILLLLFLFSSIALAQNVHFNLGGGLSSHYGSAKVVGAFKIGLGYEIEMGQHWTFTPSFEVYGKGWKDPNEEVLVYDEETHEPLYNEDGTLRKGIMSRSATQNYLEVPLLFSYFFRMGESRYIILSAGPYVAYGVNGKQKTKGDTQQSGAGRYYYENKTFKEAGTHRFDCGMQTSIGYQFPSSVTIGLEADWGIAKFNVAGKRNISALFTLGYKL